MLWSTKSIKIPKWTMCALIFKPKWRCKSLKNALQLKYSVVFSFSKCISNSSTLCTYQRLLSGADFLCYWVFMAKFNTFAHVPLYEEPLHTMLQHSATWWSDNVFLIVVNNKVYKQYQALAPQAISVVGFGVFLRFIGSNPGLNLCL